MYNESLRTIVVGALGNMEAALYPLFHKRLRDIKSELKKAPSHQLTEMEDTLNAWHRLLLLRGWLSRPGTRLVSSPVFTSLKSGTGYSEMFFGQKLARQYLEEGTNSANSPSVPGAILSICLAELHFIQARAEQLQFVVAIYLAFRLKCGDTRTFNAFHLHQEITLNLT